MPKQLMITSSLLIEPTSPQAALLQKYFSIFHIIIIIYDLRTLYIKIKESWKGNPPASNRIQTYDLLLKGLPTRLRSIATARGLYYKGQYYRNLRR